ncbi:hypothetical protein ACT009_17330 [Sphingomonas sp. Tas61C01]|uniref:hypothetical protein n=1 Tax=Sphingomonas sp. Tas61C01 TaxID=3458297 RepID=UPI00403E97BD
MRMFIATTAAVLIAGSAAHAGQTAYMPPGGTTAQGATGGIPTSPSALNVGAAYGYSFGGGSWRVPANAATPGDVRIGSTVYSDAGRLIGKVAYADGSVAVVQSRKSALRLPIYAFGTQQKRLLLRLSPYQFEKLATRYGAKNDS